jgi:hypothetical protein
MRFIKPIIILIILGLIALFIQQNLGTFNAEQTFKLSLYFGQPMVWTLSICSLLGISGAIGLVVGILAMLKPYLGLRKRLAQEQQGKQETPSQQE